LHTGQFLETGRLLRRMQGWEMRLEPKSRAHAYSLAAWAATIIGETERALELIHTCEEIGLPLNWHSSYIGTGYRFAAAFMALEKSRTEEARRHLDAIAHHRPTIEHWPFLVYLEVLITESESGTHSALSTLQWHTTRKQSKKTTS